MDNRYDALKLENQLCFQLYAAARQVVNLYNPVFKPLGITYTQYIVFLVLWEKDDITVGELCRKLYLNNGTLTPLLKRMEKDGYLTRIRQKDDERVVLLRLTDQGRALRERAVGIPGQVAGCVHLPAEKAKQLYQLLYELLDAVEPGEADKEL